MLYLSVSNQNHLKRNGVVIKHNHMKLLTLSFLIPVLFASTALTGFPQKAVSKTFQGKFYDSSQKLDFSDSSEEEINQYYGDTGSIKGEEFKEYLYQKISCKTEELSKYYLNYGSGIDGVGKWYQITDRNWALSETIDPDTFTFITSSSDSRCKNTFFYNMYISDESNNDRTKAYSNLSNGYKADDSLNAIDFENKKKPSGMIRMDKEHVWAKSHGFEVIDNNFTIGAQTDLHHLVAADGNTNSAGHNNYSYGEVDKSKAKVIYNYLADGSHEEISGWLDASSKTFEPTDEWKGDIARCLFYMATRYSEKKEVNTKEEPYLLITDDKSIQDDNDACHGVQYNLSTLIQWNELDPVSDYEKHRNNLIYHNVQNNRNPYIDHPEWVKRVFDPDSYTTDPFDKIKDSYNLHIGKNLSLDISTEEEIEVTVDDPETAKFENSAIVPLKEGSTVIHLKEKDSEKNIQVNVKGAIRFLKEPDTSKTALKEENTADLKSLFSLDNRYDNEKLVYESSDESVFTVSEDGILKKTGKPGSSQISVYLLTDYGKELLFQKTYESQLSKKNLIYLISILAAVLLIVIILIIIFAKMNKKKKKKIMNQAKKAIKKNGKSQKGKRK